MSKVFTTVAIALAVFMAFHLIGDVLSHSYSAASSAMHQAMSQVQP